jgi:hypothetical protein
VDLRAQAPAPDLAELPAGLRAWLARAEAGA